MKYHFKPWELTNALVAPSSMGLEYISAQRLTIDGTVDIRSGEEELCLACLYGSLEFRSAAISGSAHVRDMLYVPRRSKLTLCASGGTVVMRLGASADTDTHFAHLSFADVDADPKRHKTFGSAEKNCRRELWQFLDDDFPARRLMVGICQGETGGWTGWPPHEHGSQREEVYVYFDMGRAFGIQCLYEELDRPLVVAIVADGDLISMPRGYHPSVACPRGRMSYVYCMAARQPGERNFMDLNLQTIYVDKFE